MGDCIKGLAKVKYSDVDLFLAIKVLVYVMGGDEELGIALMLAAEAMVYWCQDSMVV